VQLLARRQGRSGKQEKAAGEDAAISATFDVCGRELALAERVDELARTARSEEPKRAERLCAVSAAA